MNVYSLKHFLVHDGTQGKHQLCGVVSVISRERCLLGRLRKTPDDLRAASNKAAF
jgi:hypothetical protein